MNKICVFCGSSSGTDAIFMEAATSLGKALAIRNIELVYGGAKAGLMGAVADSTLLNSGKVTGVLPYFMQTKEVAHTGISKLIMVKNMHERKSKMNELSDGVIVLPGGFGTMEEFFEMITWAQLGLHKKPVGLLNVNGYYNGLIAFLKNAANKGFISEANLQMILRSDDIYNLLSQMENYKTPVTQKWINEEAT